MKGFWKLLCANLLPLFHADFGKEFPSPTLWRGPQDLCCALCSTEQSTFREGGAQQEKVPRKEKEEGWPAEGGQKEKGTRENRG